MTTQQTRTNKNKNNYQVHEEEEEKKQQQDKQEGSLVIYWPVIPASLTGQRTNHPITTPCWNLTKKKKQKKNNNNKENKKEFISLAVRVCLCFVLFVCMFCFFD